MNDPRYKVGIYAWEGLPAGSEVYAVVDTHNPEHRKIKSITNIDDYPWIICWKLGQRYNWRQVIDEITAKAITLSKEEQMEFTPIVVKGKKYLLSVEKALDAGALKDTTSHSFGNHYEDVTNQSKDRFFVLALVLVDGQPDPFGALVNINTGHLFADAVKVSTTGTITEEEWTAITNGDAKDLRQVEMTSTFKPIK